MQLVPLCETNERLMLCHLIHHPSLLLLRMSNCLNAVVSSWRFSRHSSLSRWSQILNDHQQRRNTKSRQFVAPALMSVTLFHCSRVPEKQLVVARWQWSVHREMVRQSVSCLFHCVMLQEELS